MPRPQPGWSVAFCALIVSASTWLPWATTGTGRANAIGGVVGDLPRPDGFGSGQTVLLLAALLLVTGAMIGRGLTPKGAAVAALTISALILAVSTLYYRHHVAAEASTGYGMFIGAGAALAAAGCSVWALVAQLRADPARPQSPLG
ncbi:hypothetical protein [Mycobacterium sp. 1274756.6]|uniref:hypothetical protein n=1 Tax=Mycobacterium sp. 1274756.6 TaxID=1834076 RepID=UPI0007FE98D6|nr:hypothetical protein [Mycobacterium sp. 1274756.6]OBJ68034.1 hypothetical protein A5643_16330 [Mycobacterium sp. 1274756.6]